MTDVAPIVVAVVHVVIAVAVGLHATLNKRHSRAAFGWLVAAISLPIAGSIAYGLFGINRVRTRSRKLRDEQGGPQPFHRVGLANVAHAEETEEERSLPVEVRQLLRVGRVVTNARLCSENTVRTLYDGEQAYPLMLRAIEQARERVWLCTYIFETNPVGERFVEALAAARARGVDARVIVDGVGEWYSRPRVGRLLRRARVPFARYLPPRLLPPQAYVNLRNHRKVLVVDDALAFTGGMNIGGRHMAWDPENPHPVQDLMFELRGPVALQLAELFEHDWRFCRVRRSTFMPRGPSERPALPDAQRELAPPDDALPDPAPADDASRDVSSSSSPVGDSCPGDMNRGAGAGAGVGRVDAGGSGEGDSQVVAASSSPGVDSYPGDTNRGARAGTTLPQSLPLRDAAARSPHDWEPAVTDALCRVIPDGPDHDLSKLETVYTSVIAAAERRVLLITPYFVPPEDLQTALITAALRGVEVTVLLPEKTNLPYVHAAMRRIAPWLVKRGVRIVMQPPPFSHAKALVVDDRYVMVGSANMDPRSLRLNFEVGLEVVSRSLVDQLDAHFGPIIASSRELTLGDLQRRSFARRVGDGAVWLFSPYL